MRELTRKYGTLLIIDETHTICAGPAVSPAPKISTRTSGFRQGYRRWRSGAAYGFTEEVADRIAANKNLEDCDVGGIGGTLAGNALSLAAMRATLDKVLTKEAFDRMIPLGGALDRGSATRDSTESTSLARHTPRLPGGVSVFGGASEERAQAHDAMDFELERFMHLYAMNRGILLTPFHNMALMSPQTEVEDVDAHTKVFRECVRELAG